KQEYVAHYLGIKQQQYQRYESGVIEIPLHIAIDLAILYDVSLDYLVGMDRNK
ncbi:MAG: helix-turn-helix domain-containing protein, partial [Lachnospiraceae bacterium]|nr:helix-turn-helix domain-containing protein [Lachnospiraceae bacterium]